MCVGFLFARPILTIFGASDNALIYAYPYIMIYLIGTFPSMIATGMNPFINNQGFGNMGMLTILIGAYAQKHYLGKRAERNLTETVRTYEAYLPDYFPLVHPSPLNFRWRKNNPWFEAEVVPELRRRIAQLLDSNDAA